MTFRLPRSVITAALILAALLAYFAVRTGLRAADAPDTALSAASAPAERSLPSVLVQSIEARPHAVVTRLKGRTTPDRAVTVRAETSGVVARAPVSEGETVSRGALLCALSVEARVARVAEADAAVAANLVEYDAARELAEKGWTSDNRVAAAKAALDAAKAALDAAKIELARTEIRAPFAGVFETRDAEVGDFLAPGEACGRIVDLDPIIISVDATESQAATLIKGAPAQIELADGRRRDGTVRYIARTAEERTRTFRVEIETGNPDGAIAAGLTAEARIASGQAPAALLTPAVLALHDDGRVGVRYVDETDTVRFAEVAIVDDADEGVWVTGLPDATRIIAAGQDYVREGVRVTTTPSDGLEGL